MFSMIHERIYFQNDIFVFLFHKVFEMKIDSTRSTWFNIYKLYDLVIHKKIINKVTCWKFVFGRSCQQVTQSCFWRFSSFSFQFFFFPLPSHPHTSEAMRQLFIIPGAGHQRSKSSQSFYVGLSGDVHHLKVDWLIDWLTNQQTLCNSTRNSLTIKRHLITSLVRPTGWARFSWAENYF